MINSFTGKHRFLSNFYPCMVQYEGIVYRSVEHAYQAAKSLSPTDRLTVAAYKTAAQAKKLGRKLPLRSDWPTVKVPIMRELLMFKWSHQDMLELLLATDNEELVEGNWWGDTFWGVCNGVGQNMLGKLHMEIREHYRASLESSN